MGVASVLWTVLRFTVGILPARKKHPWSRQSKWPSGRTAVRIPRQWNDRRIGAVRWSDLEVHRWDIVPGGT